MEGAPSSDAAERDEAAPSNDENNITEVEDRAGGAENGEEEIVESVGGADAMEEAQERTPRYRRSYKIQEVIKRRQIMLVQVVKEERGTKGAALTTYLSLAGRYSVLMPNTARGGGISRKITRSIDRKKLKEIAQELEVPEGMGVILRTAGANRTKTEVKRDFEYLLRMWETVRDFTLKSTAPMLVYEEGSLIKRSIRDLYNKDIEEVLVAGDDGYREAKDFMRMLMPSHAKNVKPYQDTQPVFTRYGIESQLDAMFSPTVQLRSGGYIVINQTEALVAIDVNSGRATREHHIEDTATKTNVEAAEEIARQLRLRDLAGLIVIDFIDMDEKRNNRTVERRLKEALKNDRARIQVGRISHFGLMEMSRQRIRSSVLESSTDKCPHCGGTGHVRSVSSVTLHLLRMIEEMLLKGATHNLIVRTRTEVALYALNHKRAHLRDLESRFQITITVSADATIGAAQPFPIEKGEQVHSVEAAKAIVAQQTAAPAAVEEDEFDDPRRGRGRGDRGRSRDRQRRRRRDADEGEAERAEGSAERPKAGRTDSAGGAAGAAGWRTRPRSRRPRAARRRHPAAEAARFTRPRMKAKMKGPRRAKAALRLNSRKASASNRALTASAVTATAHADDGADAAVAAAIDAAARVKVDLPAPMAGMRAITTSRAPNPKSRTRSPISAGQRARKRRLRGQRARTAGPAPMHSPEPFEPVARETAPAPEVAAAAEPPKRRSTVREPAPMFSSGSMSDVHTAPASGPPRPAPEPVSVTPEPAATEEAKPRRFGWWSKRG